MRGFNCNQNNAVEVLESRLLMSAKIAPVMTDPALTDPAITYKNFANDPLFAAAGPSENDVQQGDLGDCYLLASLDSVAKINPGLIRQDVSAVGDGTFMVNYTVNGAKKTVHVNADLPVQPDGQLAYAGFGAQNSLWVAIMEKAYAEVRTSDHSYGSIEGGWMGEVFSALKLHAKNTMVARNIPTLMNSLAAEVKANHYATLATNSTIIDGAPLVGDHAYEIDSVVYDTKHNIIGLRLRNPWGIDGVGDDGANDGYVMITAAQAFTDFSGICTAHA